MKIAVLGAAGRMGQALTRVLVETPGCAVAGGLETKGSPHVGRDLGEMAGLAPLGVAVTDDPLPLFAHVDGVLDFTTPAATVAFAGLSAQARIVHVIGTTGLAAADDIVSQVIWRGACARGLAATGNVEEAQVLADEAMDLARAADDPRMLGQALVALSVARLAGGREQEATAALLEAREAYTSKGDRVSLERTLVVRAE